MSSDQAASVEGVRAAIPFSFGKKASERAGASARPPCSELLAVVDVEEPDVPSP